MRILHTFLLLALCVGTTAQAKTKCVHVFVALADNKHQGIVPVPKELGKGDDAHHNLYWGALYGVKTYFRKSTEWELISTRKNPRPAVLERCVFHHKKSNVYLVADAYQGPSIKQTITDFLNAAGGSSPTVSTDAGTSSELRLNGATIRLYGAADLVAYIGHNGLMDFQIDKATVHRGRVGRDAIVLACKSKSYFQPWLAKLKSRPLLLTTGLMAPEAYTLKAALDGWMAGERGAKIKERAASAYNKYQKCGIRGARNLFFTEKETKPVVNTKGG